MSLHVTALLPGLQAWKYLRNLTWWSSLIHARIKHARWLGWMYISVYFFLLHTSIELYQWCQELTEARHVLYKNQGRVTHFYFSCVYNCDLHPENPESCTAEEKMWKPPRVACVLKINKKHVCAVEYMNLPSHIWIWSHSEPMSYTFLWFTLLHITVLHL